MYDYDRQTSEEVSFQEGSRVEIFDKDDPDWFLVSVDGQYGFAPSNYLEEGASDLSPAVIAQQEPSGAMRPESVISLPPLAPPLPPTASITQTAPTSTLFAPPTRAAQPDFTDHTALQDDEDDNVSAPPTPQRPQTTDRPPSTGQPVMAPRPTRQTPSTNDYKPSQTIGRVASPEQPQITQPYRTWPVQEIDGKKKKRKGTLGLGNDEISWAPDKPSDSIQTWPINSLVRYSAEKKHVFIELQGPPKAASFDFHAGSSDAAQVIISVLGDLAGAARMPGIREVAGALNAPLPALPQNSGLARKERESGFPVPEHSDDDIDHSRAEVSGGREKTATVMYDFEAQGDDEVTVRAGAKVIILDDQASPDWWKIRAGRKEGVIPADYLELTTPKKSRKNATNRDRSASRNRAEQEQTSSRPRAQELKAQATGGKSKPDPSKIRSWTDRSKSFKVDAQLLGCSDGKIHLHKSNGVKISVPINKMSREDVEYVEHKTGRSLRDDVPATETKDPAQVAQEQKEARRREAVKAAANQATNQSEFDWFDFFLGCGCDPNVCQRYTSVFERDGLGEDDITSLEPAMLRSLGLKEGDILKVGRAVDAKLGRQREAPASFGDVLIRESPSNDGTGLLTGPGGEIKNNTRRGRPERSGPTNDVVDADALRSAVTANSAESQTTNPHEETAPVKPIRPQSTGAAPPSRAMEDLSLLAQPLVPVPAQTVVSNASAHSVPNQAQQTRPQSVPPQATGHVSSYPSQQFLHSIQQMQPQRTAYIPTVPQFMPQTSFGSAIVAHKTGGGDMNNFVPPPIYNQQTGYQQQQQQFAMMQQAPAALYQDPFKTGSAAPYQDPFKTGFNQAQPTGTLPSVIGQQAGFSVPMHQTGFPQQQTGFAQQPLPNNFAPIQQSSFMPQQTAFYPQPQPQQGIQQPQMNAYNMPIQQTGFNPAQPFGTSALPAFGGQMAPQQTGFAFQQPQQSGYGPPQAFQAMPMQQAQPQMSAGMLKLQQMMAEAQQQQSHGGFGGQPQQTQGFQPVQFGRSASAGPSGRRANLGNATVDNPFGF